MNNGLLLVVTNVQNYWLVFSMLLLILCAVMSFAERASTNATRINARKKGNEWRKKREDREAFLFLIAILSGILALYCFITAFTYAGEIEKFNAVKNREIIKVEKQAKAVDIYYKNPNDNNTYIQTINVKDIIITPKGENLKLKSNGLDVTIYIPLKDIKSNPEIIN